MWEGEISKWKPSKKEQYIQKSLQQAPKKKKINKKICYWIKGYLSAILSLRENTITLIGD